MTLMMKIASLEPLKISDSLHRLCFLTNLEIGESDCLFKEIWGNEKITKPVSIMLLTPFSFKSETNF